MGGKGRITKAGDKEEIVGIIDQVVKKGAKVKAVCEALNISIRTYQRWKKGDLVDKRKGAKKNIPGKLTDEERGEILRICCSNEYKDMNPYEIVAILGEKKRYLASESTFYRILREHGLVNHRSNSRKRRKRRKPEELKATGPNQVWSWDITYLKTDIKGKYFFLYLFMDIWSRKIVGWGIYEEESKENAAALMKKISEEIGIENKNVRLRSDNGAVMKSSHVLATLYFLGVIPSFSRPRVSNDNPYSESLFKTVKYTTGYPGHFISIDEANKWMEKFCYWYNYEHRHSKIGYVTPHERETGADVEKFNTRNKAVIEASKRHPERFKGKLRRWEKIQNVYLNKTTACLAV